MAPGLIVVSGLPGVGKSAVATLLAGQLGAVHLSIDPVEDALIGSGLQPGWTTGVAAYEAVRASAVINLANGGTVVVDAVNDSEPARETWRRAAAAVNVDVRWVVLTCSNLGEHARRLAERHRPFRHLAEPPWDAVQEQARRYASWVDPRMELDTAERAPADIAGEILRWLDRADRSG